MDGPIGSIPYKVVAEECSSKIGPKIAELKKEAYVQAINVYNEMYRNVSYGSFVMTDSGMDDLDGRI